jgi:hypothetical protein
MAIKIGLVSYILQGELDVILASEGGVLLAAEGRAFIKNQMYRALSAKTLRTRPTATHFLKGPAVLPRGARSFYSRTRVLLDPDPVEVKVVVLKIKFSMCTCNM